MAPAPLLSAAPRPVATVVGSKRPAPPASPVSIDIKQEDEEEDDLGPVRKRANLDHLSPEERLQRRKLKNRVAAQTARDKKKAASDTMELQLAAMAARLQEAMEANADLLKTNTQLQVENTGLQQQNTELQARLCPGPPPLSLPLSPPASPRSGPAPASPLPAVLPPPVTAALTRVPRLQEQGGSTAPPPLDPRVSSKDLTPWGRTALAVWCAAAVALARPPAPPQHNTPSPSPSPPLPLKKRPTLPR
jgi:hypothetical protein